jgi:threonine dehydrogenase-like Zn-dependent dehydrogenase
MKAVKYVGGKVAVLDVPAPQGPGIRVRISSCGICSSDLAMLASGFEMAGIPGHEMAGHLADGTPVAIEPIAPCGTCDYCDIGSYQVCRDGIGAIFGVGLNGGMAEEIIVPERSIVRLPRRVDIRTASLVEPLAVAVHGMRRAAVKRTDRVVVVGGGTIGLCAVIAARAIGCEVAMVARHDHQKAAAARLGALEPSGEYDVSVDSAGTATATADACTWLRSNGMLLLLACSWDTVMMPGLQLAGKELAIMVSTMYSQDGVSRDIDNAAQLLGNDPTIGDLLITHRFPLVAAGEAYAAAADRKSGSIKVLIEP